MKPVQQILNNGLIILQFIGLIMALHRSFNSGFSSQHLHHLDAITASLGWSYRSHERSPPPEETALGRTISEQALPRRPVKTLQRHTEGLPKIFRIVPNCLKYLAQDRDK